MSKRSNAAGRSDDPKRSKRVIDLTDAGQSPACTEDAATADLCKDHLRNTRAVLNYLYAFDCDSSKADSDCVVSSRLRGVRATPVSEIHGLTQLAHFSLVRWTFDDDSYIELKVNIDPFHTPSLTVYDTKKPYPSPIFRETGMPCTPYTAWDEGYLRCSACQSAMTMGSQLVVAMLAGTALTTAFVDHVLFNETAPKGPTEWICTDRARIYHRALFDYASQRAGEVGKEADVIWPPWLEPILRHKETLRYHALVSN